MTRFNDETLNTTRTSEHKSSASTTTSTVHEAQAPPLDIERPPAPKPTLPEMLRWKKKPEAGAASTASEKVDGPKQQTENQSPTAGHKSIPKPPPAQIINRFIPVETNRHLAAYRHATGLLVQKGFDPQRLPLDAIDRIIELYLAGHPDEPIFETH